MKRLAGIIAASIDSRTHREPLTEQSLLRAGTALMTGEPDERGWVVAALRTSG